MIISKDLITSKNRKKSNRKADFFLLCQFKYIKKLGVLADKYNVVSIYIIYYACSCTNQLVSISLPAQKQYFQIFINTGQCTNLFFFFFADIFCRYYVK